MHPKLVSKRRKPRNAHPVLNRQPLQSLHPVLNRQHLQPFPLKKKTRCHHPVHPIYHRDFNNSSFCIINLNVIHIKCSSMFYYVLHYIHLQDHQCVYYIFVIVIKIIKYKKTKKMTCGLPWVKISKLCHNPFVHFPQEREEYLMAKKPKYFG